jgi:hypothetical protein
MDRTERAQHYLNLIINSNNREITVRQIVNEIDSLVWSNSKIALSKEEKLQIVNDIIALLAPKTANFGRVLEASDNSAIMDALDNITAQIKGIK